MKKFLKKFFYKWFTIPAFMNFHMDDGWMDGHTYRVTGFYYRYKYADGTTSDPIPCKRRYANCIGGYGVAGCYPFFEDVNRVYIKLNRKNIEARIHFWKEYKRESRQNRIDREHEKVQLMRSMPKGLTRDEYSDLAIERVVDDMFK